MPSIAKTRPVASLHVSCGSATLHESMLFFFALTIISFEPTTPMCLGPLQMFKPRWEFPPPLVPMLK